MKVRKKSRTIYDYIQWKGDNLEECKAFLGESFLDHIQVQSLSKVTISNFYGKQEAYVGDYFFKDNNDCKVIGPVNFESSYEVLEDCEQHF